MQVPVQVLSSRHYSFAGTDGKPVNIVEAVCMLKIGANQIVGKVNTRGMAPLNPGPYSASLRASEREGKLHFSLGDFQPASQAYSQASGAK